MNHTYAEPTVAVFGDVHAHIKPLFNALVHLGWDETTKKIPVNLTIVQAGDLIHKGPQSSEIVAFVDEIIQANNRSEDCGQWVQLMGNHESQYFKDTPKFWKFECDAHAVSTIGKWWAENDMRYHFVIEQNDGKPFIVTHAGINPFWYYRSEPFFKSGAQGISLSREDFLEFRENQTVENFSRWMQEIKEAPAIAALPGAMLGYKTNVKAGPVWAETVSEVYCAWRGEEIPFHQIHGHVTPFNWNVKKFFPLVPKLIQEEMRLFKTQRRSLWQNSDGTAFYGIDNGFEARATLERMRPIILNANGVIESDKTKEYFVNAKGKLEETQS